MSILAFVSDQHSISRILDHLGLRSPELDRPPPRVRTAAAEYGRRGVRVNALGPGGVDTPLTAPIKANPGWSGAYAQKSILNRWASPDERWSCR